jgi:hypothetical protein
MIDLSAVSVVRYLLCLFIGMVIYFIWSYWRGRE